MNLPKETEIAWFAGLVDGDGSICVARRYKGGKLRQYYFSCISINLTHLETLQIIHKMWGEGNVRLHKTSSDRKQRWRWIVSGAQCQKILTLCYPYLVTKKADALVALTLQRRVSSTKKTWGHSIPDIEYQRRKLLHDLAHTIKKEVVLARNVEEEINQILSVEPKL